MLFAEHASSVKGSLVEAKKCTGVLLTHGDYLGTLAAARAFDRLNVPCFLADDQALSVTAFSRCIKKRMPMPSAGDWDSFVAKLIDYGKQSPHRLLYPTSDDTAWLLARYQHELKPYFHLYSPDVSVIYQLLNKQSLFQSCRAWDIPMPDTVFPESGEELKGQSFADGPWLLKPRTQIGLKHGYKGFVVPTNDRMAENFDFFKQRLIYQQDLITYDKEVIRPMLQRYYPHAQESIISVSGFYHPILGMRAIASRKVFQFPKRLGIGLCFEGISIPEDCRRNLHTLFKNCGYFGVFEAEFIWNEDEKKHLLIDVNPRFYGQMSFDIQRGLPLPDLVLAAAIQDEVFLQKLWQKDPALQRPELWNYGNGWMVYWMLACGLLGGRIGRHQISQWMAWFRHPERRYADAIYDSDDRKPYFAAIANHLWRTMKHPRDAWRKYVLQTDM